MSKPRLSPAMIKQELGDLPWMSLEQGGRLTDFIKTHELENILELGFYHGVSTCYLAAAIADKPDGHVVTIDKQKVRTLEPNIEQLLTRFDLLDKVDFHYEPSSYLWRLMKLLEQDPAPEFDLCYIDGAHQWATDGFAFFLVDRLLRPGGWVIFDDLDWTVASHPHSAEAVWAQGLSEEEKTTPQVRKIYELLVKTHPGYDQFRTEGGWGYARKSENVDEKLPLRTETVVKTVPATKEMLAQHLKRLKMTRKG